MKNPFAKRRIILTIPSGWYTDVKFVANKLGVALLHECVDGSTTSVSVESKEAETRLSIALCKEFEFDIMATDSDWSEEWRAFCREALPTSDLRVETRPSDVPERITCS